MNTGTSVSDAGGVLQESHLLPVAGFSNKNSHPWTWWSLHIPHVGPVPHLLHRGYCTAPSPMCTHRCINTQNTHTHTQSATGGYRSPLWKLGRGGVGEWSGAVIIFIIINFHLKLAPGLFCLLQSSFQPPTSTHAHTTTTITTSVFEKATCQTRQNRGWGNKRRKELKGIERVWQRARGATGEAGGVGRVASSLTGP